MPGKGEAPMADDMTIAPEDVGTIDPEDLPSDAPHEPTAEEKVARGEKFVASCDQLLEALGDYLADSEEEEPELTDLREQVESARSRFDSELALAKAELPADEG